VPNPILILDIVGAHFQAGATVGGVVYGAGDSIDLHFADQEYAARPDDADPTLTYEPRLDGKLTIDRTALWSGDGQAPRAGGMAMPKLSRISLANQDGRVNWMRLLSLDGAVATLRELPLEADAIGRLRPVLQTDPSVITWFTGACAGEPQVKLDKAVELELVDTFDDRLRKPVQTLKFFGLGGQIEFSGAGGAASVAHVSALNVNHFTFVCRFTHLGGATDRALVSKDIISSTGCPFFMRLRNGQALNARVNTTAGGGTSVLLASVANLAAGTYWTALTYDGATATMRYYTDAFVPVLVETLSAAITGTLVTNGSPLVFGQAPSSVPTNPFFGAMTQIRLYSVALTAAQILASLRPLDVNEPADIANMVGYWPCVERTGAYLGDRLPTGDKDAALTGTYAWGSTLTGEAAQRGQYRSVNLGTLEAVPLAKVDEALEIYEVSAFSAQQVLRVFNSELAGLTPTYAVTGGWVLNTARNTLERTGGATITTWVPGMTVTLTTGWVANNGKTLTVLEVISPTRVRISGTLLSNETAAAGLVTANNPQWKLYISGSNQYIQLLEALPKAPPVAWIQGESLGALGWTPYVGLILHWLLTESAAAFDDATEFTLATLRRMTNASAGYANDIMQAHGGIHIPAGPAVKLYDLLDRILRPLSLHLLTTGTAIDIDAVELPTGAPDIAIVNEEVEDLDVRGLKLPPPAVYRLVYRDPPYAPPQDSISAGAIPHVAELVRAKGVVAEAASTIADYATIWPTGAEDEDLEQPLGEWTCIRNRAGAELALTQIQSLANCRPWTLRVLADVGELLPGTPITITAAGPEREGVVDDEQLYGLEGSVDAVVAGSQYDVLQRRYNVTVLIPIEDLDASK
jgi:hypothetical protein